MSKMQPRITQHMKNWENSAYEELGKRQLVDVNEIKKMLDLLDKAFKSAIIM